MCPCHSNKAYTDCCKRYHDGEKAPTPTALMRSRFSAYALKKIDYIIATAKRFMGTRRELEEFVENTDFQGLEIVEAKANFVTFRATLFQGEHDVSFTEKSRFERLDGCWMYDSGTMV